MAVHVEKVGNEVYIYMNGKLTMKRWINEQRSVIFDSIAYWNNSHRSITEVDGKIVEEIDKRI